MKKIKIVIYRHFNLFFVSSTQIYLSNQMHKVAIYRRYAYQSPNYRPRWSFVLTNIKTIQHVNKHEIVFHNLHRRIPQTSKNLSLKIKISGHMHIVENYMYQMTGPIYRHCHRVRELQLSHFPGLIYKTPIECVHLKKY